MAKKVQLQTNGKEWQVIDGEQVLVDVPKQDIDPITSSSCVQIEGFRTLEEAVSNNKMLSQDLTYTKVMDKVGGDYHQNVLDGQYSKAILYGNTQVNLCEEDSSNALQIPTTFTSFNNGELQIKNKESQVVAPLIKGVTMVNLAQTTSSSITSGNGLPIHNVKGNTLYTLSFKFTTKNTNSGVVIQSYDANGTYLENTMHKTELGDVVKFTFTTHVNATKVHICNNAAYGGETIQLDDIMVIEGDQTALDIPFFKGMKSVELVRPLTNLFSNDLEHYDANVTSTNSNGTVTVTASSNNSWANVHYNLANLKANTNYLVMWDSVATNQTSTTSTDILICVAQASNNSNLGRMENNDLNPTKRCIMFNTANIPLTDIVLRVHATLGNTETGKTTVTGLRVFEYDDYLRSVDLQSIGWFSGTKNVAVEPIKTCSKNLYPYGDINFTPASANMWCDAKGNQYMYTDIASKSKARLLLRKGTYIFTFGTASNIEAVGLTDDKNEKTYYSGTPFVLTQDTYLSLILKTVNANTLTTVTNIQIERGETATDYVAHDSRYYEPDGQNAIVLRSLPNGVCDTFNLQTGEYVQRINEVVFDGSEEWSQNGNGSYGFFTTRQDSKPSSTIVCDKLKEITGWNNYSEKGIFRGIQAFGIVLTSNELTTCNVETFRQWLQQNPLTVQYQLATPVTTIIPRTIKRNNNGTVSTVDFKTYTNKESLALPNNPSYLTINSMTSIKPVVEPITYIDFKTRLKANTDYTIKLNKETNAFVTTNLGGTSVVFNTGDTQKFVKTPSIDLEQNLRISGSGSIQNIMVIEGDVLDKELPYFNGMCNVKMPIVRNMGRNLLDNNNVRVTYDTNIILRAYPTFPCKPGKRYVYCVDKLGTESACNWYSCKRDAVLVNSSEATGIIKYLGYSTSVVAPPDCKYLSIYTGGSTNLDPYSIHAYVYEVDTLAEAQAIGYTDYKENQICLTQGEIGLSQDMFEQGTTAHYTVNIGKTYEWMKENSTSSWDVRRLRTKSLIKIEPNTKLILQNTDNFMYAMGGYGADKLSLGTFDTGWVQNTTITIPQDVHYISFSIRKKDDTNITINDFNQTNFKLLKLDETIALRSLPNGVKDELNLLTGEYIQRVGEVVLDGSGDENITRGIDDIGHVNTIEFYINDIIDSGGSRNAICDSYIYGYTNADFKHFYTSFKRVIVFIEKTELLSQDVNGFKEWLQQNPITVQYELAEPIISYPRIVSNTQEREVGVKLPNGVCDTYNPSTGITVKRVGKVVLDGSEDWKWGTLSNDTYYEGWLPNSPFAKTMKPVTDISFINGNFVTMFVADGAIPYFNSLNSLIHGGINIKNISNPPDPGAISFVIQKSKMTTPTLDGFKQYLASNPITVWYELKNPIITTDIVLPNGVHDEYNPLTGLYTKRVGYIELDGSETWKFGTTKTNTQVFELVMSKEKLDGLLENNIICDKLPISDRSGSDAEKIAYGSSTGSNIKTMSFYLALLKTKVSTLNELKTYLSQNPLKVWYELATPITYQLTPYFGLPMPYAYKDGYLIMDSAYDGQTLPPEITYQLTVNRTGQITQNNIKLKEHTARLSNLEYMLIEATLDSIFSREMQNFELELMNVELFNLDE